MVSESTLCKCPYEVGDVLTTRNAADPATRWPGTSWQRITDKFILGAGGSYSVGATGGEASHVLTMNEMPEHAHFFPKGNPTPDGMYFGADYNAYPSVVSNGTYWWSTSGATGGSAAHNNMPPYVALYIWERTA